jgi:hypothetical protein
MVMLPGLMPVTTPVVGSMEPIAGLLLLHTPPGGRHVSASVPPTHTLQPDEVGHVMGPGVRSTTIVATPMVALHPNELVATTV